MQKKHSHKQADEYKGAGITFGCKICNRLITKGKKTPPRASGKCKVLK